MNKKLVGAALIVALLAVTTASPTPPATADLRSGTLAAPTTLADAAFKVGPAEIVNGPNQETDSRFFGVRVDTDNDGVLDLVRAYTGQNTTYLYEGPNIANIVPKHTSVIGAGVSGNFDECGAWLAGAYVDPTDGETIRGWYHAEEAYGSLSECDYAAGEARGSQAYAVSTNDGRTFTKPGHPNNQVVRIDRSVEPEVPGAHSGRGDSSVLLRNGEYLMYYRNTYTGQAMVSKASQESDGLPGTWTNWTASLPWTQPGLDGSATGLTYTNGSPVIGGSASRYTPDNSVAIVRHFTGANEGIRLSTSSDGLTAWVKQAEVLVPVVEQRPWGESLPESEQRVSYPSIVNIWGARAWSDVFYLFYMYIQPGNPMSDRLLIRRKVTVTTDGGVRPSALIALASWDTPTRDRWDSASVVSAVYDEHPDTVQGYLATVDQGASSEPLFDCEAADGDNYPAQNCSTDTVKRTSGYIWTSAQAGTVPLYRCRMSDGDDFVSVDIACEGLGTNKWVAGWVYPESVV